MNRLLLCSDLDRTLLPNGMQPESPEARTLFRQLAAHPDVTLAYVTGRHQTLIIQAIEDYQLPWPDYAIGDVGTTIYTVGHPPLWQSWDSWRQELLRSWKAVSRPELESAMDALSEMTLQEPEKQNALKLSYYGPADLEPALITQRVGTILDQLGVTASVIWSVDETTETGLLDIIPPGATKLHAVQFLREALSFDVSQTLYAGDSGNDLPVLASPIPAVVPANATDDVRELARNLARDQGNENALYLATGDAGLNGNYAAGILEGVKHFHPRFMGIPDRGGG